MINPPCGLRIPTMPPPGHAAILRPLLDKQGVIAYQFTTMNDLKNILSRIQIPALKKALKAHPVVILQGARQTGKTTLTQIPVIGKKLLLPVLGRFYRCGDRRPGPIGTLSRVPIHHTGRSAKTATPGVRIVVTWISPVRSNRCTWVCHQRPVSGQRCHSRGSVREKMRRVSIPRMIT